MAGPTNPHLIPHAEEMLRSGVSYRQASKALNIAVGTIYYWVKKGWVTKKQPAPRHPHHRAKKYNKVYMTRADAPLCRNNMDRLVLTARLRNIPMWHVEEVTGHKRSALQMRLHRIAARRG